MCKYANKIKDMTINNNDPQQALISLLSQQLSSRFDNLEKLMDVKIEHINSNVKASMVEVHNQLLDIKDDIKDIKEGHKEDKKDIYNQLNKYVKIVNDYKNHNECPNRLDDAIKEMVSDLKNYKSEIEKDIQWISALRKNKWILILTLIGFVAVSSILFESIYKKNVNLEPTKEIIQITK